MSKDNTDVADLSRYGCPLSKVLNLNSLLAMHADDRVRLQLPAGRQQVLPYALTVGPPLLLALSFPDLFFRALDVAGTYGCALVRISKISRT